MALAGLCRYGRHLNLHKLVVVVLMSYKQIPYFPTPCSAVINIHLGLEVDSIYL